MKGKTGIIIGLAAGYVLGSRAGRERYEQIKKLWLKVWDAPPVQKQVDKGKEFTKTAALALPSTLWDGAVKVVGAAAKEVKKEAPKVKKAAEVSAEAVKDAADDVAEKVREK